MKNILITGGSGYIGSLLTKELLLNQFNVTVIDNLLFNQNSLNECCYYKNFKFINGDICNYNLINNLIKKNDIIIPLACLVGAPACDKSHKLTNEINYEAQLNIINNLSSEQILLFPNTNSGYGIGNLNDMCDENSPLNPVSLYGKLKVSVEKEVLNRENSISLRLATVFGSSPRMRLDLLVNDFVYRLFKDKYLILFEENFRRNFIHVRDVVNTFLFMINNFDNAKNQIYNVGLSSANLTKKQLALKIKEYIKNSVIVSSEIGKDPDRRDYIVSNKKIENLGWKTNFSLDDGIKELIKCYSFLSESHTNKNI